MSEAQNQSPFTNPEEIYTVDQLHSFLAECLGPLQMIDGRLRVFVPWRKGLAHVLPPRDGYPSARIFVDDGSGRRIDPMEVFSYTLGKDLDYDDFRDEYTELMERHKKENPVKKKSDLIMVSKSRLLKLFQEWLDEIK